MTRRLLAVLDRYASTQILLSAFAVFVVTVAFTAAVHGVHMHYVTTGCAR